MAKARTVYACTECGGASPKWQGQCPHCGAWNTLVESVATPAPTRFQSVAGGRSPVRPLSSIVARESPRVPTGLDEFDRVLGGGLVPGGVILLGGDPGIGKSTLLLQAGAVLGAAHKVLYVTGEESAEQIALRAERLGLVNAPVELLAEVQLEAIVAAIGETRPEIVVVSSLAVAGCRAGPGHTRAFGTIAGTAAGAVIGGAAAGPEGALAGSIVGLAAGAIAGDAVAQDQERCATPPCAPPPPAPCDPPCAAPCDPPCAPPPVVVYGAPPPVYVYPYPYGYSYYGPRWYRGGSYYGPRVYRHYR